MTRRLVVTIVATVLATLVVAGAITLLIARLQARRTTERELRVQAEALANRIRSQSMVTVTGPSGSGKSSLLQAGVLPHLESMQALTMRPGPTPLATLAQLKAMGTRITMDDFGTGYSSLAYLHRFPFDKIKIDRCFISDLSDERDDAVAFVRAICALGQALNLTITAEGVETEEQLTAVAREGCSEIQGYIFSPPVRADVLGELIRGQSGPLPGMPQSLRDTFKLSATSILPFEKTSAQTS